MIKDEGQPINCLPAISPSPARDLSELMHVFAGAFISSPSQHNHMPGLFTFLSCESFFFFFLLIVKAAPAQVPLFIYYKLFHVHVSAHSLLLSGREKAYSSIPRGNN